MEYPIVWPAASWTVQPTVYGGFPAANHHILSDKADWAFQNTGNWYKVSITDPAVQKVVKPTQPDAPQYNSSPQIRKVQTTGLAIEKCNGQSPNATEGAVPSMDISSIAKAASNE